MNTDLNTASSAACHAFTTATVVVTVTVTGLLAACAPTTPDWDAQFGSAARLALSQQIIDPDAAAHAPTRQGIDGAAAREAIGRYRSTFKEAPPAANSFTIGVSK